MNGLIFWDEKRELVRDRYEKQDIWCSDASKTCNIIIIGCKDGQVLLVPLTFKDTKFFDKEKVFKLGQHDGCVKCVAICGDSERAMSYGFFDGILFFYQIVKSDKTTALRTEITRRIIIEEKELTKTVLCLSMDYYGNLNLIAYENERKIEIFDRTPGKQIKEEFLVGNSDYIVCVKVCDDGQLAFTASLTREIIMWELNARVIIQRLKLRETIINIEPSSFGKYLAIKTTKRVFIYEPLINLTWFGFSGDEFTGLAMNLGNLLLEILRDESALKYDKIVHDHPDIDFSVQKNVWAFFDQHKSDIRHNSSDDFRKIKEESIIMQENLVILKKRQASYTEFYNSSNKKKISSAMFIYFACKKDNCVKRKELTLPFFIPFYVDYPATHENSYLFTAAFDTIYDVVKSQIENLNKQEISLMTPEVRAQAEMLEIQQNQ
jgi:hypothetical protein